MFRKNTNANTNGGGDTMNGFNRSGLKTSGGAADPALGMAISVKTISIQKLNLNRATR